MSIKYVITDVPININNTETTKTISALYMDDTCTKLSVFNDSNICGNIYLGRVDKVVKNINSAFIKINDGAGCYYSLADNTTCYYFNPKNNNNVNEGDYLLVQAVKEPIKTKPATLSSRLELTGRFAVLATDVKGVLVSKKIKSNETIIDIKNQVLEYINSIDYSEYGNILHIPFGIILRSNIANITDSEVVLREIRQLTTEFLNIVRQATYSKPPKLLYNASREYMDTVLSIPMDSDYEIVTDRNDIYDYIRNYDNNINIRLYNDDYALYKLYDLEKLIINCTQKRVWLNCGGYLIIEPTEAMTVIDVNSGKCEVRPKKYESPDKLALKVNMEAARCIARQLRLRNISGIVIVDFINMQTDEANLELISYLKALVSEDNILTNVVDMTKLGLVEITRKRTGKTLWESITQ